MHDNHGKTYVDLSWNIVDTESKTKVIVSFSTMRSSDHINAILIFIYIYIYPLSPSPFLSLF